MTGFVKLKRCRLCVDATAELADFACGDAWLDKYRNSDQAWSVLLTRNSKSSQIVQSMIEEELITVENISLDDVKLSQKPNLKSKKLRQFNRYHLYKKLKIAVPELESGYHETELDTWFEFKVFLSHLYSEFLEHAGLYPIVLLYKKFMFNIRYKIKRLLFLN